MEELNIIADVAGQHDPLMELVGLMPSAPFVLLGDLNDRGPKSREVIEWAMQTPNVRTLNSNHGHMFVDFVLNFIDPDYQRIYDYDIFTMNGGNTTLDSYGFESFKTYISQMHKIPLQHINWLRNLPNVIETEDLILSHAPLHDMWTTETANNLTNEELLRDHSPVWYRGEPPRRKKFQVFGHNSHWGLQWLKTWDSKEEDCDTKSDYAVCLDASGDKVLTGMHWPSREIYQVPYEKPRKEEIDLGF